MENNHKDHRKRMMERVAKSGLSNFHDHELIEMLLYFVMAQGDTNPTAHKLIDEFKGLSGLIKADNQALITVDGVGAKTALLINIVGEIASRTFVNANVGDRFRITNMDQGVTYCKTLFITKKYECFYAVCLDIKGKVISDGFICEGVIDQVPAYTRKIVETALKHGAYTVILTHNHPGGNATPSFSDDVVTENVRTALATIGIAMNDHIIIGEKDYFSYASMAKLKRDEVSKILDAAQNNNLLRTNNIDNALE